MTQMQLIATLFFIALGIVTVGGVILHMMDCGGIGKRDPEPTVRPWASLRLYKKAGEASKVSQNNSFDINQILAKQLGVTDKEQS